MKQLFNLFFVATLLLVLGCSKEYDDSVLSGRVDNLENRVSKLEQLCQQMNTNISSLQTIISALQNNDYVTGVTPISENGVNIGYTITFVKSQPVTIYHGKDGKDGADGADGDDAITPEFKIENGYWYVSYTFGVTWKRLGKATGENGKDGVTVIPKIGVKKYTDGVYYWTLDGDWLLGDDGKKIKAQGVDGKDGADGTDGDDAITPEFKIENGYWYVSYTFGVTWKRLGKATGEDGTDGEDGDSFFKSVDTANSDYVIFTLANGTQIKLPTYYAFEQLKTLCNQMNTNIGALQTIVSAMQDADYIKSCTPLMENGRQIGYTIVFAKMGSIVIYHGKDGEDGEGGENGAIVPKIGIKKYTDGVYYWTLNGEWLLADDGKKVKAEGVDGVDGEDGADGTDGVNGVTPQLKIENGYWYISYDKGSSWTRLGKATGEDGKDGKDGEDGGSFFKSITQDDKNVYLEMPDGNIIRISKSYTLSVEFNENSLNQLLIPGTTYKINYTVTTNADKVNIEVVTSNNMTAKVVTNSSNKFTGYIELTVGQTVDAENNIIVFVSDCNQLVMKKLEFDVAGLKIYDEAVIEMSKNEGYANLEFLSNVECVPVIPSSAKSWISVAPLTKGPLEYNSIQLLVSENNKSTSRSATVRVESKDGKFGVNYVINQAGGQPNNEIWYTSTTGNKITLYASDGFGSAYLTNTYSNGKGVIKFESNISLVGINAFKNCSSLSSIQLPESVTSIGASAFSGCTGLLNLSIPESVTSIGASAFSGCSSLTEIDLPDGVNYIGESAFYNCVSLREFAVPSAVTSIEASAFSGCTSLANVALSSNIIKIGGSAFSGCSSLREISIPEGITTIGSEAFKNCTGLTRIKIPNSVITIETGAFAFCSLLSSVDCGNNITSIGDKAFWDCDGLTKVIIPNSVISIGNGAFNHCNGLRTVEIGEKIATIGSAAFDECETLSDVYIKSSLPPVMYGGCYNYYNDGKYSASYNYVFSYCTIYVPLYSLNKYKTDWNITCYNDDSNGYYWNYKDKLEGYEFE